MDLAEFPGRGDVTLIRTSSGPEQALELVLPALGQSLKNTRDSQASSARGWTVWLAPPFRPHRQVFRGTGLNPRHNRVVHPRLGHIYGRHLIELALRSPANAVVLAWSAACDDNNLRAFRLAARAGGTFGLLFVSDEPQVDPGNSFPGYLDQPHHPAIPAQQLTINIGENAEARCLTGHR